MQPWGVAAVTGGIVVVGKWSKNENVDIKYAGAAIWYVLVIAGLDALNEELATGFAALVLLTVVYKYAIPVAQGLGLVKK